MTHKISVQPMVFFSGSLILRVCILLLALLFSCQRRLDPEPFNNLRDLPSPGLAGSSWALVKFVSNSDKIGEQFPPQGQVYRVTFSPDGKNGKNAKASFQINCNRASGNWQTESTTSSDLDRISGSLHFGPIAATQALCPPPSMDQQIIQDLGNIASYVIMGRQLALNLKMDGGDYIWQLVSQGQD